MLNIEAIPEPLMNQAALYQEKMAAIFANASGVHPHQLLPAAINSTCFDRQLIRALIGSDFLARQVTAKPETLEYLLRDNTLYQPLSEDQLASIRSRLSAVTNETELDASLRKERQQAMTRLVFRDLNRLASMSDITAELSLFAELALEVAAAFHYQALVAHYGEPVGYETARVQSFVVLGMGKLGAAELNMSSDIDLIFAFPEAGETNGTKSISNQEFFTKLGQRTIKSLDAVTVDGFVFRVDMRLRPHGQSGALVLNFNALEDYYQTQGRDWERYAMIKARVVAAVGGTAPYAEGDALLSLLEPFTYRQYIDYSVIESLRSMKALITRQVQRKGMNLDVKLGEGGIREVEFVVQAFQLIRGGREPRLRERQVCKMLPILQEEGYLQADAATALYEAYVFLRNTEHALQAWQDRQTQALPEDELSQLRLAFIMGFASWPEFLHVLNLHRARVTAEFRAVIAAPTEDTEEHQEALDSWTEIWGGELSGEDAESFLREQGELDSERLLAALQQARDSRVVLSMQAGSRTRLDAFIPRLMKMLSDLIESGEARSGMAETFARIVPLVESIARRTAYLVLLIENPTALYQLVKLCSASPWIAEQLSEHPALLDELLTPESLYSPPNKVELSDDLRRETLRIAWDDLEGHMETLRYFRSAHALRVAAAEITGALPLMKVSDYLTYIAEVILEHVLHLSWQQMVARHGYPQDEQGRAEHSPNFIILGYGKLGGIELGHGSDLDLVFLHCSPVNGHTDGERSLDNATFYARLGQKIIHALTTVTFSGRLYEVDMRLRPSGNSGMLVATLAAFEKYQLSEAWTWEHQALVRARVVAGNTEVGRKFEAVRHQVLSLHRELPQLRHDVSTMRQKMREQLGSGKVQSDDFVYNLKQDLGGIVDIEFMTQYAVLAFAEHYPRLTRWTDNIRILETLSCEGLVADEVVNDLIAIYKSYRSIGHQQALQQQDAVLHSEAPLFVTERQRVESIWQNVFKLEGAI